MYCDDVKACFLEINSYCSHKQTGRALLVNTENYTVYQSIKSKLEADNSKSIVYVSDNCADDDLPNMDEVLQKVTGKQDYVLVGYSQAAMLRGIDYLEHMIRSLLEVSIRGRAIILLDHCEQYIKKTYSIHPDIPKRTVLVAGKTSLLPRIRFAEKKEECPVKNPILGMKRMFAYLEKTTDETVEQKTEIHVVTKYTPALFRNAIYSVTTCEDVYTTLHRMYPEISAGTERSFGTDEQWKFLSKRLSDCKGLSVIAKKTFGSSDNLSSYIGSVLDEGDSKKIWLLWLCMKVFSNPNTNHYLNVVMHNSLSVDDFAKHVYLDLVKMHRTDPLFRQCYIERKRLLLSLPESVELLDTYCSRIGVFQRDSVYYLTDISDKEKLVFMQCMEKYEYSMDELLNITDMAFPSINSYLTRFVFDVTNTKIPSGSEQLWKELTDYFEEYKIQKITNQIHPDFLEVVDRISVERPYNKLQARSAVVSKLNKDKSQLYFFDALGVEYLGYICDRCKYYDIVPEISIAHCELPSITDKNKEFLRYFNNVALDIKELDELKHHSQVVDYEQCKEPVHLFSELKIIDEELKKIQSRLKQGQLERAVIVSDHGASRLAVIFEQENDKLELEEKGKHSGRCCPAKEDPQIPFVSFWDGFAVLANYERFKGGRRANVEVHGGATLEEVVVPIIVLSKKPTNIDVCFVDPTIVLKGKEPATIVVYANIPLSTPRLVVNEVVYDGEFCEDNKHARFVMPELKRTRDWTADFYDGDKKLASNLEFRVQRNTQEQALFKNSPF